MIINAILSTEAKSCFAAHFTLLLLHWNNILMFRAPEGGPSPLAVLYRAAYDSPTLALKSALGKRMLQ